MTGRAPEPPRPRQLHTDTGIEPTPSKSNDWAPGPALAGEAAPSLGPAAGPPARVRRCRRAYEVAGPLPRGRADQCTLRFQEPSSNIGGGLTWTQHVAHRWSGLWKTGTPGIFVFIYFSFSLFSYYEYQTGSHVVTRCRCASDDYDGLGLVGENYRLMLLNLQSLMLPSTTSAAKSFMPSNSKVCNPSHGPHQA